MTQIISNSNTPDVEVNTSEELIKELLDTVQVGVKSMRLLGEGWDNMMYLVNDSYLIRLPRRNVADQLIQNEQGFLLKYGRDMLIPVPKILHLGKPGDAYPYHWTISNFLLGEPAVGMYPDDDQCELFASFLKSVHSLDGSEMNFNPYRSTPLTSRAKDMSNKMQELKQSTTLISDKIESIWQRALSETHPETKSIIHGDLHARNILLSGSRFSGIIDWGDVCCGDPATDLASIWMLFRNADSRRRCLTIYGADDSLIARSKGWAIVFGVLLTSIGIANQDSHEQIGRFALKNLNEDDF